MCQQADRGQSDGLFSERSGRVEKELKWIRRRAWRRSRTGTRTRRGRRCWAWCCKRSIADLLDQQVRPQPVILCFADQVKIARPINVHHIAISSDWTKEDRKSVV